MPKTTAEHDKSLNDAAFCELLPVRDFLDGVMIRDDGAFVAGFALKGSLTYFADDEQRNDVKSLIASLLLTIPEESMRVQFRYEVLESTAGLLDDYASLRQTDNPRAQALDEQRESQLRALDRDGEFLTRYASVYFIWRPDVHARVTHEGRTDAEASRTSSKGGFFSGLSGSVSIRGNIQRARERHEELLHRFRSLMIGVETSLQRAELQPTRMGHEEMFLEIKRATCPDRPDTAPLRSMHLSERYISAREQLATVSLRNASDTVLQIDEYLWSVISLKMAPDQTEPGCIRTLLTLGFPIVITTQAMVPDQQKVLTHYKKQYKKMRGALVDKDGNYRADVGAEVASQEILELQEQIISGSVKTCRMSMTVMIRASRRCTNQVERMAAELELANRAQKVMSIIGAMNTARGYQETSAKQRLFISSLPGMAGEDKREIDLLSEHVADLVAIELPWPGTTDDPLMLFPTPYRQLLPYSHFSPGLENANMIVAATSGTGKGVMVGKMALTYARTGSKISILERGDSYARAIEYMGGKMMTVSLDSPYTINPFDLPPGESVPSNDHVGFLKNLIRFMIGDSGASDSDLLDSIILHEVREAYSRAQNRTNPIPLLSDVVDGLALFIDKDKSAKVEDEARIAARKLGPWVQTGMYAKLFDRHTTVEMHSPWLYFNIEQLTDDPKLETAMSLLIAYATTRRAVGTGRQKCITILDECWSLLESPFLGPVVVQLFRTARKRNAAVWAVSQAVADFTGTLKSPNKFGAAIMTTTATKLIGRQKGDSSVLTDFIHLNETTVNHIKSLAMTEKGKKSEWVGIVGEKAESTFSFQVVPTPMEYWIMTTFPREKDFRSFWLAKHIDLPLEERYALLAKKYPHGLSALPKQPEELSGEVWQVIESKGATSATGLVAI